MSEDVPKSPMRPLVGLGDGPWHEPYTAHAVPKDRLHRWEILGGIGRARVVVAEKIRTEGVACLFAAAPLNRDKLVGIKKICNDSLQGVGSLTPAANALRLMQAINMIEQLTDARD